MQVNEAFQGIEKTLAIIAINVKCGYSLYIYITMLDPQAVLLAILICSAAEAGDREVSRWAGPL
jgi:hypothetical protein